MKKTTIAFCIRQSIQCLPKLAGCLLTGMLLFTACRQHPPLFKKIAPDRSGISFNNVIVENDSINPIDLDFLYNGGGVAAGDFNNDGLPDLYFTASTVSNKLYLNKGELRFQDITATAGVEGKGRWCNAASVVDINNDGWQDIYVCATIKKNPAERTNLLYINQGLDAQGLPTFKEMAAAYNLADSSFSVHAAFFDYDNDGDLDLYLVTTQLAQRSASSFSSNKTAGEYANIDKLYRNDWSPALQHPVFTDVSAQAGITQHGFGLGVGIADINQDGWKDIYVTNDFYGSDLLYINNRNGSFSEQAKEYFKHTSQNAMGNDIADINNDGLPDIVAVDMNPEDNFRKKKNMNGNNYFIYQNMLYEGLMLQYVRNTLQLNSGPVCGNSDSLSHPVFSDISFYTGTAETDWSWSPLLADVNNDGHRDLLVTNGYPRDVTDHDFMVFRSRSANIASKQTLIDQIPQIKIPNYAFENKGQLHFENSSANWGLGDASFSNGAVCLDLDNDGDLDYVINNINDPAFLYENTSRTTEENTNTHYLSIRFKGDDKNRWGIGAIATIYYGKERQLYENNPYRGYLSTADTRAFFGLGNISTIDSLRIIWPDASTQLLTGVKADQEMIADKKNAAGNYSWPAAGGASDPLFTNITKAAGVQYVHKETDYIDFDRERLLPHKLSQYGPALAVADVDGNGLDDLLVGGGGEYPARLLLQQQGGRFTDQPMPGATGMDIRKPLQAGLLFFDADGDGDADLYCASGGNEFPANTKNYADQLFINDGKGHFSFDTSGALPDNYSSKSCVKAADIDNDGDLDLFVGGRCLPGRYPSGVSSFIYRNDGSNGKPKFTDITSQAAKELLRPSMVCDALFTDFNNDGLTDLITAAEWGPLRFFKNNGGSFVEITVQTGIGNELGWWNSIAAADIDNDGDLDYIVGNLGQNSFFRASNSYPLRMYAKDFDGNGSVDAIITSYFKDVDGVKKEFTAFNRDDIVGQLPGLRRKFPTYKEFANAGFAQLFTAEQIKGADTLQANNLASCVVMNLGNGKFSMEPLPAMAQMAPLYGLLADDVDNDGNLDLVLNGNDFGNEVTNGRYDALNGLLLLGDGKGHFAAQTPAQAGLCIPGDGKALVKLNTDSGYLLAASENRGPLRLFKSRRNLQMIPLKKEERWAVVTLKNGKSRREEFYYGNSFYSQSARSVAVGAAVSNIRFGNEKGVTRQLHY